MGGPGGRPGFSTRGMLITLLPNVILPWVMYQVLTARGVSTINALIATGIVPLATTAYQFLRDRRIDALGIMTLAFVVVGIITSFISGDPIFYLVKESFLTGVWGLIMLGSLLMARPLTFYFGRQFMSGGDPARAAFVDRLWEERPSFRSFQRWLTMLWGVALLGEALLRVVLVYTIPIPVFLVVSPAMGIIVTAGLIALTAVWGKRLQRRGQAAARAAQTGARSQESGARP
jgi:hypothetical protein